MKIKEGFVLHEVGGENIVIAVGRASAEFHGVIKLNKTCAEIWKLLEKGFNDEDIAQKFTEEYDISYDKAVEDVKSIIAKLSESGVLE